MHVGELRLRNFRCFEHETFAFRGPFTVLIGDNGAGKSAVLDALAMALALEGQSYGHHGADFSDVRLRPSPRETDGFGMPALPADVVASGTIGGQPATWEIEFGEGDAIGFGGSPIWTQSALENGRTLPLVAYYSTARLCRHSARESGFEEWRLSSRIDAYRDALAGSLDTRALLDWFRRRTGQSLQEDRILLDLDVVLRATQDALREWNRLQFDFRSDELVASRASATGTLARLPFSRLSDGQRAFLALVGDIARRCATLNAHLEQEAVRQTPGVVLIDELDLHLHPRWQRTVVDDLRRAFPSLQFVATTHSPFIIQSLPPQAVIDLSRPEVQVPGGPVNEPELRDFRKASIEDITEQAMGVEMPQLSERRRRFLETAQRYYGLLNAADAPAEEVEQAKREMHSAGLPFADDLAFAAYREAVEESAE